MEPSRDGARDAHAEDSTSGLGLGLGISFLKHSHLNESDDFLKGCGHSHLMTR